MNTHSRNAESGSGDRELIYSLLRQIDNLTKEIDEKNGTILLLIKTKKLYLIQDQSVSFNWKDDVSTEKVLSNLNVVIVESISNVY